MQDLAQNCTYEYLINRQGNLSIDRDRAWHVKKYKLKIDEKRN